MAAAGIKNCLTCKCSVRCFRLNFGQIIIYPIGLLILLLLITESQSWDEDRHEMEEFLKREHSLSKPYQGIGSSSYSYWDLMGTALVTTDYVRLTPDMQSKQGAVWSRIPCHLRDWELQVHFKIHGQGRKYLHGDGLAVWYTKERMQTGPVFGNMDLFTGLGVFVDTYPNEEKQQEEQKKYNPRTQRVFPYVSAMVGNGSLSYDHRQDGRSTELGGCAAMVRNVNQETLLLIRYVRRRLTVMIDIDGKNEWRDCLDVQGVRLPQGYFFGASSVTGDLSDNHDLISLKLYQLTVERGEEEDEEITIPSVDYMQKFSVEIQDEGMSRVAVGIFSLLGCFVLGVIALVLYNRWKENNRKRFY